jgi:low affinity Fe/Cu permease
LAVGDQHRHDHRHLPDGVLIQNTQNRDTEALQLKIDELIRVTQQARNRLINLEDLTEEEMDKVKQELTGIARADRDNPDTPP